MNNSKNVSRGTFLKQAGLGLGVLFSGGIMQTLQSCAKPETVAPADTLTPLQAAKNAMRTKLESQYGSIEKIMEKGLSIVVYMSYPDTKTPEESFSPKIYAQLQNPAFVAQLNQIYTDLLQPYLNGIKINLDFQFLPLTADDISNMRLDSNDKSNATIGENATLRTGIGKKLNTKFLDYNKTQMKNGAPMSAGFAFYYDTSKIGANGVQGGFNVPIDNDGVKYTACGINMPISLSSNSFWDVAKIISHEIIGHGLTDLGIVMHTQNSNYVVIKNNLGEYELIPVKSAGWKPGVWPLVGEYITLDGAVNNVLANQYFWTSNINTNVGSWLRSDNGGIMLGGIFDPKIVGDTVIGYKVNPDGTIDKKLTLKLPEIPTGYALPKVDDTMKSKIMATSSTFIGNIVNDVRVG